MRASVVGSSPISYTDQTRNQQTIPLGVVYFDDNGSANKREGEAWYGVIDAQDQKVVEELPRRLVAVGAVRPAKTEPPAPAMKIRTKAGGLAGNHVEVEVSLVSQCVVCAVTFAGARRLEQR